MTAQLNPRGDVAVLVPAAGSGVRLGPGLPKALRQVVAELSPRERRIVNERWLTDSPLTLEELTDIAGQTPVIAELAPSGRWAAEDFQRAGGTRAVLRELIRCARVDGDAPTVDGRE